MGSVQICSCQILKVNHCSLAIGALLLQDPITQGIKVDKAIKDAIFHKTPVPESTVPSPYVPADVIVTVPQATELPVTVRRSACPSTQLLSKGTHATLRPNSACANCHCAANFC